MADEKPEGLKWRYLQLAQKPRYEGRRANANARLGQETIMGLAFLLDYHFTSLAKDLSTGYGRSIFLSPRVPSTTRYDSQNHPNPSHHAA